LWNFNGLQAEKFRIAQASAARVRRAFLPHGPGDKMVAMKKSTATVTGVTTSCHRTKLPPRPARMWRNNVCQLGFFQAFPNPGSLSPSFSKEGFGGFVGFQGVASVPTRL
jgi:hypothetical protein